VALVKVVHSLRDLPAYKVPWYNVDRFMFCIHLKGLNIRHFGMVETTGLKICRGHLQWHDLSAEFQEILLDGSKLFSGGHTNRLIGSMVIL
jgi:hypothetical protein